MRTYRLPLALAYVAAPALAGLAVGGVLALSDSTPVAVAAAALALGLPATVHVYQGAPEQGLVSFGSLLGVSAAGAVALGGIGYVIAKSSCGPEDPDYESEGCTFRILGPTLVGAGIGGVIGYIVYAAYDVVNNASVPAASGSVTSGARGLRVWLSPLPNALTRARDARQLTGVQLRAAIHF